MNSHFKSLHGSSRQYHIYKDIGVTKVGKVLSVCCHNENSSYFVNIIVGTESALNKGRKAGLSPHSDP